MGPGMISSVLDRVADRLTPPGVWIQEMMGWDGRRMVGPLDPTAVAWDLLGAITKECGGDPEEIALVLDVFKRTGWGSEVTCVTFNDDPEREQDEVIRFLRERAALLRMEDRQCRS